MGIRINDYTNVLDAFVLEQTEIPDYEMVLFDIIS